MLIDVTNTCRSFSAGRRAQRLHSSYQREHFCAATALGPHPQTPHRVLGRQDFFTLSLFQAPIVLFLTTELRPREEGLRTEQEQLIPFCTNNLSRKRSKGFA